MAILAGAGDERLVFVYLVVRGLRSFHFFGAIRSAEYWWLIPGVAMYMIAVQQRAWRWHYLLKPIKPISTNKMFPIVCIGYMGNNIYPAAGEVLRAVILNAKKAYPSRRRSRPSSWTASSTGW